MRYRARWDTSVPRHRACSAPRHQQTCRTSRQTQHNNAQHLYPALGWRPPKPSWRARRPRSQPQRSAPRSTRNAKNGVNTHLRKTLRQCDPSLSFHWHDDPPQEVRAFLHDLLHRAPALVVILLHFTVALLQLHPRRRIELVTLRQPRPIVRFSSLHRSSDHCACQMQTATFPQQSQLFFVRRLLRSTFAQFQCRRSVLQEALRTFFFGCAALPHLVFASA